MPTPQEYEGQWTAKADIKSEHLLGGALQRAPENCLTLGLVSELHRLWNRKKLNVATLTGWINIVFGTELNSDVVYQKVKEIQRTRETLRRKKKSVEMAALEEKEAGPYFAASLPDHPTTRPVPDQQTASQTTASTQTADRAEVKKAINTSHWHLRRSVTRFEQVRKQTIAQQTLYRELQDKVGKYATKNVKRREARYQSRIQKLRRQVEDRRLQAVTDRKEIASLKSLIADQDTKLHVLTQSLRRERMMKNYAKRKLDRADDHSACQRTIKRLKRDVADAECGAALPGNKHVTILANQTFTNEVRECVLELSSLEVAAAKVAPVIHTVARHLYQEDIKVLPKRQVVQNMVDESQFLVKHYYSKVLRSTSHWGLNKDGTSRQKRKIVDTAITTGEGDVLPLGYTMIAHEDSGTIVRNVKNQLDELICCALDDELTLPDIVGKLTYTMSDRAANEKKADRVLGEWKTEVVGDQQAQVVHHFYCMAHALLGFHSYSKKQLSEQQKQMKKDGVVLGRDVMPVYGRFGDQLAAERLPMHVSAIVGPMGDERNGVQDKWTAYCKDHHIKSQIPTYKDNRFNALFETSAAVVTHHADLVDFVTKIKAAGNKNLKVASALLDLQDANVMAIVVALGITFVTITGPFWAMVTDSSIHYLNLHNYIQPLHTKVQYWLDHPHDILSQGNIIFPDFPPKKDHPMVRQITGLQMNNETFDNAVKAVMLGIKLCCEKQLADFLTGGIYAVPKLTQHACTANSGVTNLVCERHFGTLDASQQRRRHAKLHYHSSILLLKSNRRKFFEWLRTSNSKEMLWRSARREGMRLRRQHQLLEDEQMAVISSELDFRPSSKATGRSDSTTTDVAFDIPTAKKDDWVCVAYDNGWYPGSVTGAGDDLEVDFLQPCATAGSYRRPSVRDVASVARQFVFHVLQSAPVPVSGGRLFRLCESDVAQSEQKYQMYKEKFMM